MGSVGTLGDGMVSCRSQWPDDLQRQGIPVARLVTTHHAIMHSKKTAVHLADLIEHEQSRWGRFQVEAARISILHKMDGP
jgi:hypothetical protein